MFRSFLSRYCIQVFTLIAGLLVVSGCGGPIGPTEVPVPPVLPREVAIQGTLTGTVNDEFPLSALVKFDDSTTSTVTAAATWASSNADVASVNASGLLQLRGVGECDITVAYTSQSVTVRATAHVVARPRPLSAYTMFGILTDSVTGRAIGGVSVLIVSGANSGRSTTTDGNGYYSIPTLLEGTFRIRFSLDGYEAREEDIVLSADARRDFTLKEIPLPRFSDTYNVTFSGSSTCRDISVPAVGTVTLSGTTRELSITVVESDRGITRSGYRGSLRGDGTFSGNGTGVTNLDVFPHEFRGGVEGRVSGRNISGTEDMTVTLGCSDVNGNPVIGRVTLTFNGSR